LVPTYLNSLEKLWLKKDGKGQKRLNEAEQTPKIGKLGGFLKRCKGVTGFPNLPLNDA
jgi:hypothetical protein